MKKLNECGVGDKFDINNNCVGMYESITEASKATKISRTAISIVCLVYQKQQEDLYGKRIIKQ